MGRTIATTVLGVFLAATSCDPPPPNPPAAQCTQITEDRKAEDHCSKSEEECEKTLSKLLYDAHKNRCPTPPCSAYSASVDCTPLNQECPIGENDVGLLFATTETIRCR